MTRISLRNGLTMIFVIVASLSLISILFINGMSQRSTQEIVEELANVALVQMEQDAIEALRGLGFGSLKERASELSQMEVISYIHLYNENDELVLSAGEVVDEVKPITYNLVDYNGSLSLILQEKTSKKSIGYLEIGVNQNVLLYSYNISRISYVILFVSTCILLAVIINIFFSRRVLAPIEKIDLSLDLIKTKPWKQPKLQFLYGDEIGEIAKKLDETAAAISNIEKESKEIEDQLVVAEEKADAVFISSLTSIAETADKLDTIINYIDDELISLLNYIQRDKVTNDNAKSIYNLVNSARTHISILQASGNINRNIMTSAPKSIKLEKLISIISDTLDKNITVINEYLNPMYCYIDYLRLAILLTKISNIFGQFDVTENIYEKNNEVVISLSFIQDNTLNDKLSKTDILQVLGIMKDGKIKQDIGNIQAIDIIYINVVTNLLHGDFNLTWSNAHQAAIADLSIPFHISSEEWEHHKNHKLEKKLSIVTDDNPVMPSRFFMNQYGVSVDIVQTKNINIQELISKDCIILDCSANSIDISCSTAKKIHDYCLENNLERPKLGALFFQSEYEGELMDKVMNGDFDFPYHKPYKINKIISDYLVISEGNGIDYFNKY